MKSIFTFFLCLATALAFGQSKTGEIKGKLEDPQHQPIDGATVTLLNSKNNAVVKTAVSDHEGVFAFENIAPGEYVIAISSTAFQKKNTQPFTVNADQQI